MNNVSNGAYKYCEYYYILYIHSVVQLVFNKKAALLHRAKGQRCGFVD